MRCTIRFVAVVALLASSTAVAQGPSVPAGSTAAPAVRIERRSGPIAIDGRLDDADWQRTPAIDSLTQSTPTEGAPGSEPSRVWFAFDDEAIYVAARYEDRQADSIMAYLVRRDRQNQSDLFMVYLDPYRDGQNGYQFIVSAAGVQREGTLFADNFQDDTWDAVWDSAVERDEQGWSVEVRIPFSQLRMRDGTRQAWGVNVGRGIGRRSETAYLVPRLRQGSGFVSRFASLEGLDGIQPRARREFIPYVTQKAEVRRAASGDPFFDGQRFSPGIGADFRLGLGQNLQVDGAVNPDFGQVEVDPAVVNLSDFEVFFQERRPFFVEGTNIFRFGQGGASGTVSYDWPTVTPFYSRRIGRPPVGRVQGAEFVDAPSAVTILGASKLTGRVSNWNVGALASVTGREEARYAGATEGTAEIEPLSFYGAGRVQRSFAGGRYGVGALGTLTQRAFDDDALRAEANGSAAFGGVDGWVGLDSRRDWVLLGQAGATRVSGTAERLTRLQLGPSHYFQRPDADHVSLDTTATALQGGYGRLQLQKQRGAVMFHTGVGAISPGFEANDLGFASQTDHVNAHVMSGYRWTRPGSWFQSASMTAGVFSSWDFGGNQTRLGFAPSGNVQFRDFTSMYVSVQLRDAVLDNRATRGGPLVESPRRGSILAGWYSDFRRPFSYGVSGQVGRVDGARGPDVSGDVEGEWRPSTSVNVRFSAAVARSRQPAQPIRSVADPLATETYGRRYVFGELDQHHLSASLRVDWIFSPRASLELYVQPLVSSVRYESLRELVRPRTQSYRAYGEEGSTWDRDAGVVDPDGDGPAPSFQVGQPDFTFASLRGNAVFRWEYRRGSTLYLVWTQQRSLSESRAIFAPGASLSDLLGGSGNHVLLLKASYWLSR